MERTAIPMWLTAWTGVTFPSFGQRRDQFGNLAAGLAEHGLLIRRAFRTVAIEVPSRPHPKKSCEVLDDRRHPRRNPPSEKAMATGTDPHTGRTGTHRIVGSAGILWSAGGPHGFGSSFLFGVESHRSQPINKGQNERYKAAGT